jgi:hypothetical protein
MTEEFDEWLKTQESAGDLALMRFLHFTVDWNAVTREELLNVLRADPGLREEFQEAMDKIGNRLEKLVHQIQLQIQLTMPNQKGSEGTA